jgi:sugar-specific transcriptional regulator TrmB
MQKELQQIGLHKNEALIYQYLLQHGLSSPPQIAKGTGIARTNCYNILRALADDGLVTVQSRGKRKAYVANDPEALFQRVRERKEQIEELLPDLRAMYATHQNKPVIRFFDGFEAVKEIYYMTLSAQEVFGIGSTNELERQGQDFYTRWLKEVKKKNIVFHDILSHASGESAAPAMKEILRGLYDYHLMPERFEDFPTDILIWNDNIALLTLEKPIFGTVITSPTLTATFRILFHALWDGVR